jgi:cytochrome oxidase Cu insertion factor (SCO1/SenC/PrrC family)
MLQAEAIGKAEFSLLSTMAFYINNFPASFPQKDKDSLINLVKEVYVWQRKRNVPDPVTFQMSSVEYYEWLVNEAMRAPILYRQDPLTWVTSNYTGEQKDRLATGLLFWRINNMDDATNNAFAAAISSDYYRKMASPFLSRIKPGAPAFPFALRNTQGNMVKLEDFRGKLLVMDFWFTGCSGCAAVAPVLEQIAASFTTDDPIRFVSVSLDTDRQQWLNSVHSGRYATKGFAHLYTNGLGYDYPMISYYSLHAMPSIIIIDADGKFVSTNAPREYTREGIEEYISYLRKSMAHKEE